MVTFIFITLILVTTFYHDKFFNVISSKLTVFCKSNYSINLLLTSVIVVGKLLVFGMAVRWQDWTILSRKVALACSHLICEESLLRVAEDLTDLELCCGSPMDVSYVDCGTFIDISYHKGIICRTWLWDDLVGCRVCPGVRSAVSSYHGSEVSSVLGPISEEDYCANLFDLTQVQGHPCLSTVHLNCCQMTRWILEIIIANCRYVATATAGADWTACTDVFIIVRCTSIYDTSGRNQQEKQEYSFKVATWWFARDLVTKESLWTNSYV